MCGIAGICCRDGRPVDRDVLRRMAATLAHRGPDGEGIYTDADAAPSVGLASRRLAIIDIEGGLQPMSTDDGAYTVIYNGELFNADTVRRELEAAGRRFHSYCDTEVVLRGYAEWGEAVLGRLNGMWAFAVWDRARRRLFLARDRLGVKPLVYADTPAGLVFGSEIKALVASGLVRRELNPDALPHYLSFFAVPEPHSFVRGVRRLPAGHSLTIDVRGARERQYWDCSIPEEEEDRGGQAYSEEVESLLDDSVRRRLISDRPLGVLLSAGVDSSLMAALAARHLDAPVRTFTLGFDRPDADERAPAREMAKALGAQHTEAEMGLHAAVRKLPDVLEAYDEPGELLLQTYFVCELASRDVTVALSGLGGDELFSAYPTHVVANLLARLDRIPRVLRDPALAIARLLPSARLARAVALAAMEPDERATRRLMHQTDATVRSDLLAPDVRAELDLDAPAHHLEMHYARALASDPLNRMLYVFVKTYLTDELLRASDAMSMAHSLELRTPFLDYRLVERAMAIPARHKMRGRTGKLLLRDVAGRVLPRPVMTEKKGFSVPLGAWLRGELKEPVRDLLASSSIRSRGIFDAEAVERVLRRCLLGDERLVPPVMMLYCFELWAQGWLDAHESAGPGAETAAVRMSNGGPPTSRELSVIVVNWNTRDLLRECITSLERHLTAIDHEIIVVDNASSDGSADMVAAEFSGVRLLRNAENVGFGRANNQAMRLAEGRLLLLLNADTVLTDDSVTQLVERVRNETDIGVAQCRLMLPDGRVQHSAYRFPSVRLTAFESLGLYKLMSRRRAGATLLSGHWAYDEERDVDWVAGAFMLVPKRVFEVTGGFDEGSFMYGEDLEWCYRIREHGWRIRYYPSASITHFDHASSDLRWRDEERLAICLRTQRDVLLERHGPVRTRVLMALQILGAALRMPYYHVRHRLGGSRASAYGDMQRYTVQAFRALLPLVLSRR
jgi:asparagine synthase (glutamine-hydrolysing)